MYALRHICNGEIEVVVTHWMVGGGFAVLFEISVALISMKYNSVRIDFRSGIGFYWCDGRRWCSSAAKGSLFWLLTMEYLKFS